jgi:hypothetical protein
MAQSLQRGNAPSNGATGSSSANAGANGSATTGAAASTDSNKDIPRDARIIGLILASLGVTDAEPGVVAMLLEFAHRECEVVVLAGWQSNKADAFACTQDTPLKYYKTHKSMLTMHNGLAILQQHLPLQPPISN